MMRRHPVRSVLSERKMFSNGGTLPTSRPVESSMNQPSGILASSSPLIDAVSQEILAPMTGGAMPMADGGIARFQRGGGAIGSGQAPDADSGGPFYDPTAFGIKIPTITPTGLDPRGGIATFNPKRPIYMDPVELYNETPSEIAQRIFPDSAANTGKLTFDEKYPEFKRQKEAGEPYSYASEAGERLLEGITSTIGGFAEERAQDIGAISDLLFDRETRKLLGDRPKDTLINEYSTVRKVAELIQRRPDLENEVLTKSKQIVDLFVKNGQKLDGEELGNQIAAAISYDLEKKGQDIEGYGMAASDVGQDPDAVSNRFVDADNLPDPFSRQFKRDAGEPGDVIEGTEAPTTAAERANMAGDVGSDIGAGVDPLTETSTETSTETEAETKDGTEAKVVTEARKTEPSPEDKSPAEVFAETFGKEGMSKKEATKTIADFKKEFMDEMPEYEGMSEAEKGFALMEAGLRVAAGKSSNAITNVAEGLKGLGPQFAKDEKEKRAWNRQVELSAAKYGLEQLAKDTAQARADKRNRITMYDMTDPKKPKAVSIGMDQILANDGELPSNLVGKNIMSATIKAANDTSTRLRALLTENAKTFRISANEAETLRKRIEEARKSFVSGENGVQLLAQTKLKVAKGDIGGFGNAAKELIRKGYALADIKADKNYTNISSARADVRRAFQALIPESLGSTQTANSISDRDVRFLADAFVNSGFLADGSFSFATVDDVALGKQLDGAIQVFRNKQKQGLTDFDSVINRINEAERNIQDVQKAGIPIAVGPFGRDYFSTQIQEVTPFAQQVRDRLSGKPVAPTFKLELQDGVYRRIPVKN